MRVHQESYTVASIARGFIDLSERVRAVVGRSGVRTGLCTVFLPHTSASLLIQENADPSVLRDLSRFLVELAPESSRWEHDDEGPDDMPGHLRAMLLRTSEAIPVTDGKLALGTWQALYLWEHRAKSRERTLIVHVAGV